MPSDSVDRARSFLTASPGTSATSVWVAGVERLRPITQKEKIIVGTQNRIETMLATQTLTKEQFFQQYMLARVMSPKPSSIKYDVDDAMEAWRWIRLAVDGAPQ